MAAKRRVVNDSNPTARKSSRSSSPRRCWKRPQRRTVVNKPISVAVVSSIACSGTLRYAKCKDGAITTTSVRTPATNAASRVMERGLSLIRESSLPRKGL
jgi:hypothetical protein